MVDKDIVDAENTDLKEKLKRLKALIIAMKKSSIAVERDDKTVSNETFI